jgi:hypothetical protein
MATANRATKRAAVKAVKPKPVAGGGRHLGDLGTAREAEEITFGWFGATIRTNPEAAPELEMIEFMNKAASIEVDADTDLADAVGAMDTVLGFLQPLILAEDWDQFWDLAKRNRQTVEDLMTVAMRLVEVASGFPSGRPSDSPAGRSRTKQKSKGASSSPATRALSLVRGRPDLQAAIVSAQEARQAGRKASA